MQFYAQAIFVMDGLFPGRGGTEVMGGAVELARKAIPITSVPELHRQLKPVRDYFPCLLGWKGDTTPVVKG